MNLRYSLLLCPFLTIGCFEVDKTEDSQTFSTEQTKLIQNYSNNFISPIWSKLQVEADSLVSLLEHSDEPLSLIEIQLQNKRLFHTSVEAAYFEIGPASDLTLSSELDLFPIDTGRIEFHIRENDWDLDKISSYSSRGVPALEYIFHTPLDSARLNYALALAKRLQKKINTVVTDWNSTQKEYFENLTGVANGSAISKITNAFIFEYEVLKKERVGVPAGIKNLGEPLSHKVESFYGKHSLTLIEKSLNQAISIFEGENKDQENQYGFAEYLKDTGSNNVEEEVIDPIREAFQETLTILNSLKKHNLPLQDLLSDEIKSKEVKNFYEKLQLLVGYLKVDMTAEIQVKITFIDDDGD